MDSIEKLKSDHKQNPLSIYLREIVFGGIDGIITTFAVVAGFSGASLGGEEILGLTFATVLLFGVANLLADGVSMALGNYMSVKAEADVYSTHKQEEVKNIDKHPASEYEETLTILAEKGFSKEDAKSMADIISTNPSYWAEWMMNNEIEMLNPEARSSVLIGLATFLSFVILGAIPLIPYLFSELSTEHAFLTAIVLSLFALLLIGLLRWRVTNQKLLRSVGEVMILGSVAALVAFVVGTILGG